MPNTPADWPVPIPQVTLIGKYVHLEPLTTAHHSELLRIFDDELIWKYLTSEVRSETEFLAYLEDLHAQYRAGTAMPFVVRSHASGKLVGMTRIKNLSRENRNGMVGTWFSPEAWGTGANTETKLLLLTFAFEDLGCVRVEFHADLRNGRSRAALKKLGATEEGILRSNVLRRDGHRRDTVIISILDSEWADVKCRLQNSLSDYF